MLSRNGKPSGTGKPRSVALPYYGRIEFKLLRSARLTPERCLHKNAHTPCRHEEGRDVRQPAVRGERAPGCFPWPGNTLPGPCRTSRRQRCSTFGFTSSARATSPIELPRFSRCTAASLNSLVNILLDNPMTQFSFEWILSLNSLCQKWGQVHCNRSEERRVG